ncbi:MAG: GH3 auxin-responsive promoter family protein [Bacteroidota bacterium]|nr:GH3 auxin-responsive promoter family protein [Bacteroidota bacterium]
MKKRVHDIELFMKYPIEVQKEVFSKLIQTAKNTEFGKKYAFSEINELAAFKERVPIVTYEKLYPYIERIMRGEQNILWPSEIRWFAKSSGTTNARSKFIPVSQEALDNCHYKGGKDMIAIYVNNNPDTKLFTGKGLAIGGSHQNNPLNKNANSFYGDISAVIMKNLPFWAQYARTPGLDIALMDEWEKKIEKMALVTANENVTSLSGVPTWTIILLQKILEQKGKSNILEIWPNLEVFVHGAVSFTPYRSIFQSLIPSPNMRYLETYNASEGFFGIQDQPGSQEMLLMLDYGIFYEFVPIDELEKANPKSISLESVEVGKNYAMVISTNAGLWRYLIGDTIRFTSVNPFRIKVSGRTKHFINAFGEELIIENAEVAITKACEQTNASIDNFTAAPRYMESSNKGRHEWIVEFTREPSDLEAFSKILDETLRQENSDYDAKRYKDIALEAPTIHSVPMGTFYNWMKKRGKLGGQNKVPRLSNSREYLDDILKMLQIKI